MEGNTSPLKRARAAGSSRNGMSSTATVRFGGFAVTAHALRDGVLYLPTFMADVGLDADLFREHARHLPFGDRTAREWAARGKVRGFDVGFAFWPERDAGGAPLLPYYSYTHSQWAAQGTQQHAVTDPAVAFLRPLFERVRAVEVDGVAYGGANQCIFKCYADAEDHIGKHSDKARSIAGESVIVNVSLGATRTFTIYDGPRRIDVPMAHGSAVLMTMAANLATQHSVEPEPVAGQRNSLVFRTISERYTERGLDAKLRQALRQQAKASGARRPEAAADARERALRAAAAAAARRSVVAQLAAGLTVPGFASAAGRAAAETAAAEAAAEAAQAAAAAASAEGAVKAAASRGSRGARAAKAAKTADGVTVHSAAAAGAAVPRVGDLLQPLRASSVLRAAGVPDSQLALLCDESPDWALVSRAVAAKLRAQAVGAGRVRWDGDGRQHAVRLVCRVPGAEAWCIVMYDKPRRVRGGAMYYLQLVTHDDAGVEWDE